MLKRITAFVLLAALSLNTLGYTKTYAVNNPRDIKTTIVGTNVIKDENPTFELGIEIETGNTEFQSLGAVLEYDATKLAIIDWDILQSEKIIGPSWNEFTTIQTQGPTDFSREAIAYEDINTNKGYIALEARSQSSEKKVIQNNTRILTIRFKYLNSNFGDVKDNNSIKLLENSPQENTNIIGKSPIKASMKYSAGLTNKYSYNEVETAYQGANEIHTIKPNTTSSIDAPKAEWKPFGISAGGIEVPTKLKVEAFKRTGIENLADKFENTEAFKDGGTLRVSFEPADGASEHHIYHRKIGTTENILAGVVTAYNVSLDTSGKIQFDIIGLQNTFEYEISVIGRNQFYDSIPSYAYGTPNKLPNPVIGLAYGELDGGTKGITANWTSEKGVLYETYAIKEDTAKIAKRARNTLLTNNEENGIIIIGPKENNYSGFATFDGLDIGNSYKFHLTGTNSAGRATGVKSYIVGVEGVELKKITNLRTESSDKELRLSWDIAEGAESYKIVYTNTKDTKTNTLEFDAGIFAGNNRPEINIAGIQNGGTVQIHVYALKQDVANPTVPFQSTAYIEGYPQNTQPQQQEETSIISAPPLSNLHSEEGILKNGDKFLDVKWDSVIWDKNGEEDVVLPENSNYRITYKKSADTNSQGTYFTTSDTKFRLYGLDKDSDYLITVNAFDNLENSLIQSHKSTIARRLINGITLTGTFVFKDIAPKQEDLKGESTISLYKATELDKADPDGVVKYGSPISTGIVDEQNRNFTLSSVLDGENYVVHLSVNGYAGATHFINVPNGVGSVRMPKPIVLEQGGGSSADGLVVINLYDWDGTKIKTEVLPNDAKKINEFLGIDADGKLDASLKPSIDAIEAEFNVNFEYNHQTDDTQDKMRSLVKGGYDQVGWTYTLREDGTINSATPNIANNLNPGNANHTAANIYEYLVKAGDIVGNIDIMPAYVENDEIGKSVATRRYEITRSTFEPDGANIKAKLIIKRPKNARRIYYNNGDVRLRLDYLYNSNVPAQIFTTISGVDIQEYEFTINRNANTNAAVGQEAFVSTVFDNGTGKSSGFNISKNELEAGK